MNYVCNETPIHLSNPFDCSFSLPGKVEIDTTITSPQSTLKLHADGLQINKVVVKLADGTGE